MFFEEARTKKRKGDKNEKKRFDNHKGQCGKSSKSQACILFLAGPTSQQTQSPSLLLDAAQGPPAERRPIRKWPGGPVALFNIQERHLVRGGSTRLERRGSRPPPGPHPGLISTRTERRERDREGGGAWNSVERRRARGTTCRKRETDKI